MASMRRDKKRTDNSGENMTNDKDWRRNEKLLETI